MQAKTARVALGLLLVVALWGSARAEENSVSHYLPGAFDSFKDTFTLRPLSLTETGLAASDPQTTVYGDAFSLLWEPGPRIGDVHWGMTFLVPHEVVEVKLNLPTPAGLVHMRQKIDGIGDVIFTPAYFGLQRGWFQYVGGVFVSAPTGDYRRSRIANLGLNYWTISPTGGISYLNLQSGWEATALTAIDLNTRNDATRYQSGALWHLDYTIAHHFPNGFGVGASGFVFQQVTADTGAGATRGRFEERSVGIGPNLSYLKLLGEDLFVVEGKWLPEIDVKNRNKGDYFWFRVGYAF